MQESYEAGYKRASEILSASVSAKVSEDYVNRIYDAYYQIEKDIRDLANSKNLNPGQLQGFIGGEAFHKGTFNLNAVIRGSKYVAEQPNENGFGSADLVIKNNSNNVVKEFSAKFYNNASGTYSHQSETPYERYCYLKAQAEKKGKSYMSFDEFLKRRGLENDAEARLSMYLGQGKLIPADQMDKVIDLLKRQIAKYEAKGDMLQVQRYTEVLETLTDVIKAPDGTSSIKLTYAQSLKIAAAAKNDDNLEAVLNEAGVDIAKLVTVNDIMRESFKAGTTAAIVSLVVSFAPVIFDEISHLINEGHIDSKELAEKGLDVLSASSKAFTVGTLTSAISTACLVGKFGEQLKNIDPYGVATLVVLAVNTIDYGIKLSTGKINNFEMAQNITRLYFTTGFAYAGGLIMTAILPEGFAFSYMIGSFIGGLIGSGLYTITENVFLSFCIDSGCTFFGIVEQDYTLPKHILEELGFNLSDIKTSLTNKSSVQKSTIQKSSLKTSTIQKSNIEILKRGVIAVGKIGYLK